MSKENTRKVVLEKQTSPKDRERPSQGFFLSKNFKKIYPIGLHKSGSTLSLSSLSLSLSQNSNDSDSTCPLAERIAMALRRIALPEKRELVPATAAVQEQNQTQLCDEENMRRCNWITKNSDKVYVQFHDECWGVPVYEDNQLFELLALSGMLMDHNWTEILKRKEIIRVSFHGFDPNSVARIEEKDIIDMACDKTLMLAESRVRCIIDNAKCILKIQREFGSFSGYIWGYVNYKPMINKCKHPRNVPLRTPKAESLSKDLLKRGFRLVGPVIVYSFMQAAGLSIDHLVDCFRFHECVGLAERPWRHI
ncbi:DNA-3-methyladenine glycosylase 1 [Impatiens glandulifera]|uniref:DNA-3-methyladenine glycosylase 1 n=1 Tax=Impatiens glandulifera TaxID=253017 RepID=UPI001FB19E43|nr:DNA-3-methyladenine glycosylase 1 [Impatiens glandulifera]